MTEKNNFYQDMLNAQKQIEAIDKDGKNPFFKSDYATLNATILACKKALNDNNILVLQPIESDENGVYVCTTLIHSSGDKISSKMHIREAKSNDPQAQGSAITYARRYSLKSMLCMTDNDDDGEKAQETYRNAPTQAKTQEAKPTGLQAKCKTCGAQMIKRSGVKNDKEWTALFCPNAKQGVAGHDPIWL